MRMNPYYNKNTMNLKQLIRDLEKQGFTCEIADDGEYLIVHYLCFLDYVEIALTSYKDWYVAYFVPFKVMKVYRALTNWSVIKLLNKLLVDA